MTIDARLDYLGSPLAMRFVKHLNSAGAVLHDSALPAATQELVKLRASQINGCGFCTDMHIKDALHAGESQERINLVAVGREAKVFTEPERLRWSSPSRAPASPTRPVVSPIRPERTRPSITTTASSAR